MKVEILKYPTDEDWLGCKDSTMVTVGKNAINPPTMEWKRKMLKANHSPVRMLEFKFRLIDIPYWVSVHLCRHIHAVPFVKSQRNDRQNDYDRKSAPQDQLITMDWFMNAEELITISHKRLCNLASKETREVVQEICNKVVAVCPEFEGLFVPMCVYRNGLCDEFNCCGYNKLIKDGNDFPCKIGDTFYYVDTLLFKNITEVVCKGFREIGNTIYILGDNGSSYYIGGVCFTKAEAEKALKEREKK